jgi:hypothetical protein
MSTKFTDEAAARQTPRRHRPRRRDEPQMSTGAAQTAHRPVNDSPPTPKPKQRPGWLGGW